MSIVKQSSAAHVEHLAVVLLGALTAAIAARFRFLPVFDYPHWIYQAHVVANFSEYSEWFELDIGPIPNLGSTILLWPLSHWFGAETAGRVLVSIYAISVVLAFYYLLRGLAGNSGFALFGPVYAFNYFFFNGFLSFLIGIPILLLTIGIFVRIERMTPFRWISLTFLSAFAYVCHLFIWLPILLYAVIQGMLAFCAGFRRTAAMCWATQALPFLLLIMYIVGRTSTETLRWGVYQSLPNKLLSLVAPILPFSRTDPFPSVLPILVLNGAVALMLGLIAIAAVHLRKRADPNGRSNLALPLTASVLIIVAVLFPLYWFAGMGAVDQRLVFVGFILMIAYLGSYLPSHSKYGVAVVAVVVLGLQYMVFLGNNTNLQTVHNALKARTVGSSMHVAALRRPPIYGECDPSIWNFGLGVFPLQWFPIFDVIERDRLNVGTFDTAILHNRADSKPSVSFSEYESEQDHKNLINTIETSQSPPYEYLVLLGCPRDIESVSSIWHSGKGELVNQSTYHRLVKLR